MSFEQSVRDDFFKASEEHFMSDTETKQSAESYGFDEAAAGHAEDFANRIDKSDAYIGKFLRVWPVVSDEKGTHGVHFDFEAGDGGTSAFTVWTMNADKSQKYFGYNMLMALMALMGVKALHPKKGKIDGYDDKNKKIEKDGDTYPDLCNKSIGVVLQKELYNRDDGKEAFRMNLLASFHPETKQTASEIREKVAVSGDKGKLAKIMRSLRTKDSRTAQVTEPSQPGQGLPAGDY